MTCPHCRTECEWLNGYFTDIPFARWHVGYWTNERWMYVSDHEMSVRRQDHDIWVCMNCWKCVS